MEDFTNNLGASEFDSSIFYDFCLPLHQNIALLLQGMRAMLGGQHSESSYSPPLPRSQNKL